MMARRFRALVLSEGLGSSLEPTWWLTTSCYFSSRGLTAFPGLSGTSHAHGTQTCMQAKYSYVQNKEIFFKKLKSERIGRAKVKMRILMTARWWASTRRLELV